MKLLQNTQLQQHAKAAWCESKIKHGHPCSGKNTHVQIVSQAHIAAPQNQPGAPQTCTTYHKKQACHHQNLSTSTDQTIMFNRVYTQSDIIAMTRQQHTSVQGLQCYGSPTQYWYVISQATSETTRCHVQRAGCMAPIQLSTRELQIHPAL